MQTYKYRFANDTSRPRVHVLGLAMLRSDYMQWVLMINKAPIIGGQSPIDRKHNKKDGYRQQNVRQRQKLISRPIIDYDVRMTFY